MAKLVLWGLLTTSFLLGITQNTYAQCSFTSVSGGTTASPLAWTTNATWSPSSAPSTSSPSGNVCIGNGVYTSVVRLASATTFNGSVTINVQANSTLIVNGDLHVASNMTVIVQLGGTLTINGTLYTDNAGGAPKFTNLGTVTTNAVTINGPGVVTNGSASNSTAKITVSGGLSIANSGGPPTLTNYGIIDFGGSVDTSGPLNNSGTMTVGGNYTAQSTGSQLTTNTGTLTISGNAFAYGAIQLAPATAASSTMTINGSLTVNANENMKVGTGSTCTTSAFYANLIVKTNVNLTGSGDITVYSNGRLVVFGNIDGTTSSGTYVTVNCGGQAYVNGNINISTGGGNTIANNNGSGSPTGSDGSPITGLYVNGTTTAQNVNGAVGTKSSLQTNDNTFYNYIAGITGSPLPITLSFFKLREVSEEGITLEWGTSTELNFDHFNLQRSVNGKDFETIAEVQGNGTTKESHSYNFTDKMALSGTSYYRLQSVDFDGYTETFNVISVKYESGKSATLYPNPITDSNLNIRFNFIPSSGVYVSVVDLSGAEVVRGEIKAGEMNFILPISVNPGMYVVRLNSLEINKVIKVIVK